MIINDQTETSSRRRPKTSKVVVRPSVRRSLRARSQCVRAIRYRVACVRACMRIRGRERRPAHSRGGKRSQQVGSAVRRDRRPVVYSSDLYARVRPRRVFHVSSFDYSLLCVVIIIIRNLIVIHALYSPT